MIRTPGSICLREERRQFLRLKRQADIIHVPMAALPKCQAAIFFPKTIREYCGMKLKHVPLSKDVLSVNAL